MARERRPVVTAREIKAGAVRHLTRAASPQFVRPIFVRVIREITELHPQWGWVWIEAYQLDAKGMAVEKRQLFALREGLRWLAPPSRPAIPAARRPVARSRMVAAR